MTQTADEGKVVAVLAVGFGLVGFDRFLISTMFPVIAADMGLGYADIGSIAGALSLSWGTAALLCGNLSDRVGRRRVLVGSLLMFSLLIGASGLATGLSSLIMVRVLLGFADGAFTPASISATIESSSPEHVGRNIGIQQMMLTLCGLGISPLAVAALLHVMDWRWVFSVFVIPALLTAWLTARIIPDAPAGAHNEKQGPLSDLKLVLSYRNVWIAMIDMLCWLACLITTSAFMPSYLEDYLLLAEGQMGTVMSAIGFGATAGTLILPWLSDRLGRKPVMLISAAGACSMLWALKSSVASTVPLFLSLFMVHFFNNSAITLTVGPVCSEAVPPGVMASATGIVIAVGELLGGGLAPILVGQFVEQFGIEYLLWLPIASTCIGFLASLFLEENHGLAASCWEQDGSASEGEEEDSTT